MGEGFELARVHSYSSTVAPWDSRQRALHEGFPSNEFSLSVDQQNQSQLIQSKAQLFSQNL